MSHPILFLDIDGVLNDHTIPEGVLCGQFHPDKVALLNQVLLATDARIVLSSAWRYLVHRSEMDLRGMGWLLQSHGILAGRLVGVTKRDNDPMTWDGNPATWRHTDERGKQIAYWVIASWDNISRYAVVDDLDLGISEAGHPFVQTNGKIGLTQHDARRLIEMLGGPPAPRARLLPIPTLDQLQRVMLFWNNPQNQSGNIIFATRILQAILSGKTVDRKNLAWFWMCVRLEREVYDRCPFTFDGDFEAWEADAHRRHAIKHETLQKVGRA